MHTPPPTLPLDIEDAECAENEYGRKVSYHIILRLGASAVLKGRFGGSKIQFFFKSGQICRLDRN